jgi:ABC-type Fe3+ transport system permease subunit
MTAFARWWVNLSWTEATLLALMIFILFCIGAVVFSVWREGLEHRAEIREAALRKRMRRVVLLSHDPSADRTAFKDQKGVQR